MNDDQILDLLIRQVAAELGTDPDQVEPDASFMRLGVSSVQALKIVNRLRQELGRDINPVALFEFTTIEQMSEYLADESS
ncbi:acyl carrier protein [Brachybacterium squillarum]|uniref:acyl carrier protein n=1 Tax=Brachybacterium squillarum TaxID=661979 RepID=UPI00026299A9|nr:acyl carrier protein [Brachybacterium squillarum]